MTEKAEYELKRRQEAEAQRPDWEKLWAEQVERAEKAEAEVEKLKTENSMWKAEADELRTEIERLRAALEDIACGAWVQRYEALRIARIALSQGAVKGAAGQTAVADSDELTTG